MITAKEYVIFKNVLTAIYCENTINESTYMKLSKAAFNQIPDCKFKRLVMENNHEYAETTSHPSKELC